MPSKIIFVALVFTKNRPVLIFTDFANLKKNNSYRYFVCFKNYNYLKLCNVIVRENVI